MYLYANAIQSSTVTPHYLRKSALSTAVIATTLLGLNASPALAQQSIIEEVLVTAQKREQSVQDVSVAVSAFSGDAIEKMGFEEGLDITLQVPNMNFFAIFGEASSPSVSLRGISLVNFSDSWESPVSIYVDDVYRGNPAGSAIQLFDLQRVEVLRGPQGTLYGRNTTGGLVHYVSKKPTDELDAYAKATVGSYSERIVEGAVGGPLTESIKGRIAVKATQNSGWQTNVINGESLNDTDNLGYRAQLAFEPNENAQILWSVHGSQADQKSVGFAHMGYLDEPIEPVEGVSRPKCSIDRIQSGLCTSYTFGRLDGETPRLTGSSQVDGQFDPEHVATGASDSLSTKIDTFGSSINVSLDLKGLKFTSITAYEKLDKFLQDDGDGTEVVFFDEQYSADSTQYTQEFRLTGTGAKHKWVAGFYYYNDDRALVTQAPTTADGLGHEENVALRSESYSLFGQYEQDISQRFTLITGLRYTTEDRDFRQRSVQSFYKPPINADRDLSEDAVTGRLGIDWRLDPDTLAYVSVSTGFKSGGFSGSYNALLAATQPVEAETITNLEVGYKKQFANGRMRLNTAAFIYEVQGYQAQVFLTTEEGSVVTNAGDVIGKGLEVELNSRVTENFELIAGLGLLDSEFDSEQQFKVAEDDYSLDGNELPSAPGLTYNLVARYYVPLGDSGELALQADYAWQDDHYLQIENDPYSHHEGYGITNARVSWQSPSNRWSVAVFAKNLTNEQYYTYQNTLGDDWGYGVWGKPRTVGASVGWSI